jgi:hypothetical protein
MLAAMIPAPATPKNNPNQDTIDARQETLLDEMDDDINYSLLVSPDGLHLTKAILKDFFVKLKAEKDKYAKAPFEGEKTIHALQSIIDKEAISYQSALEDIKQVAQKLHKSISPFQPDYLGEENQKKVVSEIQFLENVLYPNLIEFLKNDFEEKEQYVRECLNDLNALGDQSITENAPKYLQAINKMSDKKRFREFVYLTHIVYFFKWVCAFEKTSSMLDFISPQVGKVKAFVLENKIKSGKLPDNTIEELKKFKEETLDALKKLIDTKGCDSKDLALYLELPELRVFYDTAYQLMQFHNRLMYWGKQVICDEQLGFEWDVMLITDALGDVKVNTPDELIQHIRSKLAEGIQQFQNGKLKGFQSSVTELMQKWSKLLFTDRFNVLYAPYENQQIRKEILSQTIETMIKAIPHRKTNVAEKLRYMQRLLHKRSTVEKAFKAFGRKVGYNFLRLVAHIPHIDKFESFWKIGITDEYLTQYLTQVTATRFLRDVAAYQSNKCFVQFFSMLSLDTKNARMTDQVKTTRRNLLHQVAVSQPQGVFNAMWSELLNDKKNEVALVKTQDKHNGITLGNFLLCNQPPEVFLNFWNSLNANTKRTLLFDQTFLSVKEHWNVFHVASIILPKPLFQLIIDDVHTSLQMSINDWQQLLLKTKDCHGCCLLDVIAAYCPEKLNNCLKLVNMKIDTNDQGLNQWLKDSPIVKSVRKQSTNFNHYQINVFYKNMDQKDSWGKTRLYWEAFRGNTEALTLALSHMPENDPTNKTITDKVNDSLVSKVWDMIEAANPYFSFDIFQRPLEYRQGYLLNMAVFSGQLKAVKTIVNHIPNGLSKAFYVAIESVNRLGMDRVKPIMEVLLQAKGDCSWLRSYHRRQLARLGYRLDFDANSSYPIIKPLRDSKKAKTKQTPLCVSNNSHLLMKQPSKTQVTTHLIDEPQREQLALQ